jgi:hypothetical protein
MAARRKGARLLETKCSLADPHRPGAEPQASMAPDSSRAATSGACEC